MAKQKPSEENKYPKGLYKRSNGNWVVQFVYRGKRHVEDIGPCSLTMAKETLGRRRAAAAEQRLKPETKIKDLLFETAMTKYLEWYEGNRAEYTYMRYAVPASKALKTSFDGKRLSQISEFLIEAHKLDRKRQPDAENPDRKPVTNTTLKNELVLLRHMYNKMIEWKFASSNPVKNTMLPKPNRGRTRYLSKEEAQKLLTACSADLRLLILTALHTGFRKKELRSLRWSSLNLVNGSVTVESLYAKNGETRTVPLSPDLALALQKLKDERKPKSDDIVFTYEGRPWTTWRKSFRTALKAAGIKDFRWHDLRHCFGSWLAMANVPAKAQQELMGHKSIEMTARYTHLSVEYKRNAVASLPQFATDSSSEALQQPDELQQKPAENADENVLRFASR